MDTANRRIFKLLIREVIRELFKMNLRHDNPGRNGRGQNGWKDMAAVKSRN
jgi:hypothetical protein